MADPVENITQKHQTFVSEPMWDKGVKELAGIGEAAGNHLILKGYAKAWNVFGQYLALAKDGTKFIAWLRGVAYVSERNAIACYNCLKEWDGQHM